MKMPLRSLVQFVVFSCVLTAPVAASADIIYDNGPINGNINNWSIGFESYIGESFVVSGGTAVFGGLVFGVWLRPGDTLIEADVTISSLPFGGQTYLDQHVSFSASNCFLNGKGYDVCDETGLFQGPGLTLNNGTYYLELGNATASKPYDPIGWDENDGVGCTSPGCPSIGYDNGTGTIPSEAFTLFSGVAGTTPEPGSLVLLASGFTVLAAAMRRRLF